MVCGCPGLGRDGEVLLLRLKFLVTTAALTPELGAQACGGVINPLVKLFSSNLRGASPLCV